MLGSGCYGLLVVDSSMRKIYTADYTETSGQTRSTAHTQMARFITGRVMHSVVLKMPRLRHTGIRVLILVLILTLIDQLRGPEAKSIGETLLLGAAYGVKLR